MTTQMTTETEKGNSKTLINQVNELIKQDKIKSSITNTIKGIIKNISPNRSPSRSRSNSIGNSGEDQDAPPTEERLKEARGKMINYLQMSGFVETDFMYISEITDGTDDNKSEISDASGASCLSNGS